MAQANLKRFLSKKKKKGKGKDYTALRFITLSENTLMFNVTNEGEQNMSPKMYHFGTWLVLS